MPESAARAELLVKSRRYEEAVELCRDELAGQPNSVELRLVLGRALMSLHRDDEAEAEMSECLRLRPGCAEAYRTLAELAFRHDNHEAAEHHLAEAIRLKPDDAASLVLLEIVREVGSRASREQRQKTPAAAAAKLPAAAAAARRSIEPDVLSAPAPAPARIPSLAEASEEDEDDLEDTYSNASPGTASAGAPTSPSGAHGRVRFEQVAGRRTAPRRRSSITRIGDEDATSAHPLRDDDPSVIVRLGGGLGEHLVQRGLLSRELLFRALGDHYQNGGRLGDAIVRLGFADRDQVEAAAAEYLHAQGHASRVAIG